MFIIFFALNYFREGMAHNWGGGVSGPVRNKYLLEKTFVERINDGNGIKRQQVLKKILFKKGLNYWKLSLIKIRKAPQWMIDLFYMIK